MSAETSQISLKEMLANPSKAFSHPSQVVSAEQLSHGDKVKVLKQWELDARLLQVASEEGMSGGEASMLADVKQAQDELGVEPPPDDKRGAPTKTGI